MMEELSLHILDVAENAVAAGATLVEIEVQEDRKADTLVICVRDNGRGMEGELLARVTDPFVTTRRERQVGLGVPFLKMAAEACNGGLQMTSAPNGGTMLTAWFQHSHLDRAPLGDMVSTLLSLTVGYPGVDFVYRHTVDDRTFCFDPRPIKAELNDVPLSDPAVLRFLRKELEGDIRAR